MTSPTVPPIRAAVIREAAMEALRTLSMRLPAPRDEIIASVRADSKEHPTIKAEWADRDWSCYDAHRRLVFCVRGTFYFRQNNDDWGPCVIKSEGGVWWTSLRDEELIDLAASVAPGTASVAPSVVANDAQYDEQCACGRVMDIGTHIFVMTNRVTGEERTICSDCRDSLSPAEINAYSDDES